MRGILNRARVVCHPESEPQKNIALDTEQNSTPHLLVSYGGSSASGAQPSVAMTRTPAQATREVRTGPTEDATRTSSKDDIGGDVAMREDNADENRAEPPSSSGLDGRRRITTKREPREVRDAQTSVTAQHVPRIISQKKKDVAEPSCGYHTRGTERIPREMNEGRERREEKIELGVHFISRSTRHDALRLQHEVST